MTLGVVAQPPEIGEFEPCVDIFRIRLDGAPHAREGTVHPQGVALKEPRQLEQLRRSWLESTGLLEELDRKVELVLLNEFVSAFEVGLNQ